MGDHYAYTTGEAVENGDITIEATETKLVVDDDGNPILDAEGNEQYVDDGDVNIYYGNKEHGLITTGGNLTVTGTGDVYVDSDLDIGGDMTLRSTGADSEVLLTLTNIGKVQADRFTDIIESAINGMDITGANKNELINRIEQAVKAAGTDYTFGVDEANNIVEALINNGGSKVEALNELKEDIAVEYMHDLCIVLLKELKINCT